MIFHELSIGDHYTLEKTSRWPIFFKKVDEKHYVTIYSKDKISGRHRFELEERTPVYHVEKLA